MATVNPVNSPIDKITVNGTDYTITDSSVPQWAKQTSKPEYNGSEIKYTGTTGNVVTNNTTLNVALKAIDDAIGNVVTLLSNI